MESSAQQIAHNLSDSTRSKDVIASENLTFGDFNLSINTQLGLSKCGFHKPSPIQIETVPLARCGFDLIIQSKAGTGKTCIFTIVALEALQFNPNRSTQSLIIAPTREIAIQIHEVINQVGSKYRDLRCALCIGGVEVKRDRSKLRDSSCQIVVGTPGRIKQLIELNILQTQQVELFVLDEADKLMDEQFKSQIDDIYKRLPADKQMIVTSATYPEELARFLQQYMQSAKDVRLGKEIFLEAVEEWYLESKAGHSSKNTLENKLQLLKVVLIKLMKNFNKCFIFTNYQARAPLICDNLNSDENFVSNYGTTGYICAELPQDERNTIFMKFKNFSQRILVSTDVSARGIDIQGIELVINFDLPVDNATYYHRIGRAGRFGRPGMAISIVSGDNMDQSLFRKSVKSIRLNKMTLSMDA